MFFFSLAPLFSLALSLSRALVLSLARPRSSHKTTSPSPLLLLLSKKKKKRCSIVLENSGVAEPQNIRDKFSEAVANGHPLATRLHLDTMVTVVDAASFVADFASRAPLAARPDLGEGGNLRPVVDLLVEQVECADFVILNKVDQLSSVKNVTKKEKGEEKGGGGGGGGEQGKEEGEEEEGDALASLRAIVASLNPLAKVSACERGRVDIEAVFGRGATGLVAKLNVEGQHRGAVAHATALAEAEKGGGGEEGAGGGGGGGGCAVCAATGEDKKEKEGGHHQHSHHHDHHHHHHDHHHHHHGEEEMEKKEHKHEHGAECAAKGCTEGHDHHHHDEHHHEHHPPKPKKLRQETTAAARFGIRSFVYRRRRPFHPGRLRDTVLRWLPVATNAETDGRSAGEGEGGAAAAAAAAAAAKEAEAKNPSPIRAVLRSKGFMWMSHSHATAFYWSHAGQHFEIRDEGDWWAAVPAGEWPEDAAQRAVILADFEPKLPPPSSGGGGGGGASSSASDDEVVARALASRYGDRRQEIVFIGAGMDEARICEALDGALLTEAELARYDKNFGVAAPLPSGADAAAAAAPGASADAAA